MSKVAICVVVRDSYPETTLFLKSLIKSIDKVDARLNIIDWGSTNENAISFSKEAVKVTRGSMGTIGATAHIGQAYDAVTAFVDPDDEFICFLKPNVFLSDGWLLNLIYHYGAIEDSGLVGIRSMSDPCEISFIVSNEDESNSESGLLPAWTTKTNMLDAPAFISQSNFNRLGGFTEIRFDQDFYFEDLSYRAAMNGLKNYYVIGSSCVKAPFKNDFIFPPVTHDGLTQFKAHIDNIFSEQIK